MHGVRALRLAITATTACAVAIVLGDAASARVPAGKPSHATVTVVRGVRGTHRDRTAPHARGFALSTMRSSPRERYLVLHSGNAGVILQLAPFRYVVTDGAGRTVLAASANVAAASAAAYSIANPMPGTFSSPEATTPPYAPLTYTVGTSSLTAMSGGPFQADLVSATMSGTTYETTTVTSETHTGSSAHLTLATNEGTRHVTVDIAPDGGGFRFRIAFDDATNVVGTDVAFVSTPSEAFRGFGGRHDALDQRGTSVTSYVDEENQNPLFVPGATTANNSGSYLFPNGPLAAYNVQASFVSSAGYGFFLRRPELSEFRLALDRPDAWHVGLYGAGLDYTVTVGEAASIVATQTALGGRQPEPPLWALEPGIDRAYANAETSAADYYAKVETDIANIRTYAPPISYYRLEGWALLTPAQVQTVLQQLHALGLHMVVYLNPYAGYNIVPQITLAAAIAGGYEPRTAGGAPYIITTPGGSPSTILDFTNPATVTYWNGIVNAALDTGADGFMSDFGEQVMPDMVFANGETGLTMHNEYPARYLAVTRAATDAYAAAHPGRQIFTFSRAGFTGSAGYETGNFPGDETADYGPASGLASLAPDMLNRSIGGSFGYTTDIGGYFEATGPAPKELFLRWAAWSALTPFFRLHNGGYRGTEMPWDIDADTVTKFDALARLHARFVPLIDELWRNAIATGVPIVRPLWLAFPDDAVASRQTQEWMLGPDVLVAPVVVQSATSVSAYLPAGCWQEQNGGRTYQGRRTVTVPAPIGTVPYFFRCGAQPVAAAAIRRSGK